MTAALRIASLLPSATEMVCALGAEAEIVGVSHECDWPASVVGRPVLTTSKVKVVGRSGEIDRDVRALIKDALAVYDIDDRALAEAAPDVIVTQDLCDVCAVSFDDVLAAARRVARPDVRIVNLHPTVLADIWTDIRKVAAALGREAEAEAVLADMDRRVEHVRQRAATHLAQRAAAAASAPHASATHGPAAHAPAALPPAVLTLEWIDPPMVGGTWMPELVALAGGRALVTKPGEHAPTLSPAQLRALDPAPDVVVIKPCGFTLPRLLKEADALGDLLGGMPWPAVREGRVWVADGNAYFNRPGPRIVDSLEIMAACVHPDVFPDLAARHAGAFRRFGVRA